MCTGIIRCFICGREKLSNLYRKKWGLCVLFKVRRLQTFDVDDWTFPCCVQLSSYDLNENSVANKFLLVLVSVLYSKASFYRSKSVQKESTL